MSFVCHVCGKPHDGFPALTCRAPSLWLAASEEEQERDFKLSDDLCSYKSEHFFVRCVLLIPVNAADSLPLEFGVWASLSEENFYRYVETFDDDDQSKLGSMFGWFSNALEGYPETLNLKCMVWPQDRRQRPLIELEPTDHPLAVQQREGVSFEQLTRYMHDQGFA